MSVNLLLLSLTILSTLFLHLIIKTKKHLVTVFLVLDLLLLHHFGVFKLEQLILVLVQSSHPVFLLIELGLVSLAHFNNLVVKSKERSIMWLRLIEIKKPMLDRKYESCNNGLLFEMIWLPQSHGCKYNCLTTKGNPSRPDHNPLTCPSIDSTLRRIHAPSAWVSCYTCQ